MKTIDNHQFIDFGKKILDTLGILTDEIDSLKKKYSDISDRITVLFSILDKQSLSLPSKLETIAELERFILTSAPGTYKPVIKDINLFRLLVGDEESLLYYPKFVSLQLPNAIAFKGMLVSTFIHTIKDWI